MISTFSSQKNSWKLGWWLAGTLAFVLSTQAWALDLNQEMNRMETDSTQIIGTLGRGKLVNANTSAATRKTVFVRMIKAKKRSKRV